MRRRFGLHFEVMTRAFVAKRRQQRGFGVNSWATHHRFIISHALLPRPEYREPLLQLLGERFSKSLLILDEAHVAAPATRSRYAVDSDITTTIRDLASRFDNRLFLSATPHNGHSNSFSALLEILDPIRFTRGVPVEGKTDLAPIMVRRLKRDLKKLGIERVPDRVLIQFDLAHEHGRWSANPTRSDEKPQNPYDLGAGEAVDLQLADMLDRYTKLCAPEKGAGRLPFIRLQQRLLSSPEAFAKSLDVHARAVKRQGGPRVRAAQPQHIEIESDPDLFGPSDEFLQDEDDAKLESESAKLPTPTEEAAKLLESMQSCAEKARRVPDAKVRTLLAWMRENLCPAIGLDDPKISRKWTDRRVILFTEWADTKRYLVEILNEAVAETERGEDRVASFTGGLGDDAREEIQRRFNEDPEREPLRILVATDAAREGINLQAHCADLFHIDLPWNPARLEQRNGRIDRTLQPEPEVRCHYFVYPARSEDLVLKTLVRKVDTVQREMGSLGSVLLDEMDEILAGGIRGEETARKLEAVGKKHKTQTIDEELEEARKDISILREENRKAGRRYDASRRLLEVNPDALRDVVDIGLRIAGSSGLVDDGKFDDGIRDGKYDAGKPRFRLPTLDRSWDLTLDTLRPPRPRDESFYDWRKRPPLPVTFSPVGRLTGDVEQLHLSHPFTKRVLDRFLSQGFSAHDLRRITAVIDPDSGEPHVIGYARLTLFGPGAARLHDEIIAVAAPWDGSIEDARALCVIPNRDASDAFVKATEARLAASSAVPKGRISASIAAAADALMASLWSALEIEADARSVDAKNSLASRAHTEADAMRALLVRQRKAIQKAKHNFSQLDLFDGMNDSEEMRQQQRQLALDLEHMDHREKAILVDLEREPAAIENLYAVRLARHTPVGVIVCWPRSWT
jgi:superfamily II DNA or RNA helicase